MTNHSCSGKLKWSPEIHSTSGELNLSPYGPGPLPQVHGRESSWKMEALTSPEEHLIVSSSERCHIGASSPMPRSRLLRLVAFEKARWQLVELEPA